MLKTSTEHQMHARSARLAWKLAWDPRTAPKRGFCGTDGAPSTNGPTAAQPLVAAVTIFLLEKRGEVLTPRSLPRTQSWHLNTSNSTVLKRKISRFFFFCDITNSKTQRVTNDSLGTESLAFHPNSAGTSLHAHTPSLSPKDELSLSERHLFQINEALTKVAIHQWIVRAKRDQTEGKNNFSWVILI